MNKTIAILIFTLIFGCNAFAQASQFVLPPYTTPPVVTITQQQFDSLVSAATRGNQMELIAKQEAERMFDIYTTHVSWVIGLFGVLVALFGAALPYLINRNYEKRIEKKIADHDEEIKQSRQSLSDQSQKNEQLMSELEGVKGHVDNVESSIKEMQEQVKQSEDEARKSASMAEANALFTVAWNEKDTDKRISLYTEVLEIDPKNAMAYNNRGYAWVEKGDYDRATEDYNKAIKLSPQLAETYYNKGVLYRRQGDYDQAIENYTKATETNPHLAPAYINRGFAYMKRGKDGDYVLAKADFEKGLTLNPDEEIRQKLQENLHKLEDWMKGKADKASAQQP